jgi:hypothetical protein
VTPAALGNLNRLPRFCGALGAEVEHPAEPVEGAGVKEGPSAAFAVLPGPSRSDYLRLGALDRPALLETLIGRIARLT